MLSVVFVSRNTIRARAAAIPQLINECERGRNVIILAYHGNRNAIAIDSVSHGPKEATAYSRIFSLLLAALGIQHIPLGQDSILIW